ncbi:MAG: response regulator [Trichodesmium sp.]
MQTEQTEKIMGYFIEEAQDHLNTIVQGLLNLQITIENPELLAELFRAAHSVKGGAAMLGINSIRDIAHRLEDSFKILQENSVTVDDKLESLFLQVFDTLQDLLEKLSTSGLTENEQKIRLEKVKPIFTELEEYLSNIGGVSKGNCSGNNPQFNNEKNNFFVVEVPEKMREMLLLFKQNDDVHTRNQLKYLTLFLAEKSRKFDVTSNWYELIEVIKGAISNTENTYYILAHQIIKNLKQAQELIIDNLDQEIVIDENLKLLAKNQEKINKNNQNKITGEINMLNQKNDSLINNGDSIDDWFNSLETPDGDHKNDNLILEKQEFKKGPEVGMAELNSLADLFEGETPDLDSSWEEEEILDQGKVEANDLKVSVDKIDDSGDLSDLLFDVDEIKEKSAKKVDENEWDFVTSVDADFSDLFDETGENELQKNSKIKKHNSNLQRYRSNQKKSTEDLSDLFSELNQGDLAELEDVNESEIDWDLEKDLGANTTPERNKLSPQSQSKNAQIDEFDFADLLTIQDEKPKIKNETKIEKNQQKVKTKNDFTSKAADLEALFDDLEIVEEKEYLEENQVESAELTSNIADLFGEENLDISEDAQELIVDELDWEGLTENTQNDLNSLLEDQSLDFGDVDSNGSLENTLESLEKNLEINDNIQENYEISADLEDLFIQEDKPQVTNKTLNQENDNDLDKLIDVVDQKNSTEIEKTQEIITKNEKKVADYQFVGLEAILNAEKSENYNVFLQLEKFLNGAEINSEPEPNGVTQNVLPETVKPTIDDAPDKKEDPFDGLDKLLDSPEQTTPRPNTYSIGKQIIKVPAKQLDNLSNLVGELVVNRNSLEQGQERMRQFLDNLLHQVMLLSDAGQRMHDLYEKTLLERAIWDSRHGNQSTNKSNLPDAVSEGSNSTRKFDDSLDLDRVENFTPFHLLAQETIEYIVRVRESASDIEFLVDDAEQVTRQLRQVTNQLQEGFTKSRMIPFSQTAQPLPLAVRQVSTGCGKEVGLQVEGKETLIDKMIQDKLSDPMKHLMNNAITHGIEAPEKRLAAGKSRKGKITIRAFHQGNQTVISVADDGAGIDPEKVKSKAIKKGFISEKKAQTMSNVDVYDLLFRPGFSTNEIATNFAGRGVGLDVVKTNLADIRGTISIDSSIGKGTEFTIRLPLTLSISKALCCISDRSWIAFPMDGVEDMVKISKDELQTGENDQNYIEWRGMKLPFCHLRELLIYNRYLRRGNVYGMNAEEDMISIVVLRSAAAGGIFLAVQVDQVLEQQKEIVIKQLEGPVPKPLGIAGATVLGDGKIVAIADVIELINLATGKLQRDKNNITWTPGGEDVSVSMPEPKNERTVLIVDDSITVRELLSMTFSKAGYRVEQARDGKDAWEKLRAGLPCDLVFCDIEMPRMDGFELLNRMQKDPALNILPVAMLTSRGAKKHMEMAFELGAKGYFTKPYIEDKLLEGAVDILEGRTVGDVVTA